MVFIKKVKSLAASVFFIFFCLNSNAQQTEVINRNGELRITVPAVNGVHSPAIVSKREFADGGSHLFFAFGSPAQTIMANQKSNVVKKWDLQFSDLALMADFSGHIIGAAYPLDSRSEIYVTALHLLKRSQFINQKFKSYQAIGFINPSTGRLYDIAFLIPTHSSVADILKFANSNLDLSKRLIVQHLSSVDRNYETTFSRSEPTLSSYNNDYVFLRNNENSFLGPGSSGAVIYSENDSQPLGSVVCASHIVNNEKSVLIRALRFSVLSYSKSVLLDTQMIDGFEVLPCDIYDGRRAGGD